MSCLPIARWGGGPPKAVEGQLVPACALYPSTILRVVPLPMLRMGRQARSYTRAGDAANQAQ